MLRFFEQAREVDFQVYVARLQHIIGRDTFAQVVKTFDGVREKVRGPSTTLCGATDQERKMAQDGQRAAAAVPPPQRPTVLPVAPRGTSVVAGSTSVYSGGLAQGMLGKRAAPLSPR